MGRHGVGVITDNGERLVNFCQQNDLFIGRTLFAQKEIHKFTWTSPDDRTQNQVDHIIINSRWRLSLQDVRVMRHADIGSDHSLLGAKVPLKLRKAKTGDIKNQHYDVVTLKDPKVKEAQKEDRSKNKLLDTKSLRLKEIISKEYSKKDKVVKTSARRDKRRYIDRLVEEAETAAEHNDMWTVYQNTRKLKGDYGQHNALPVRAEDGTHVTLEEEKLKRCEEAPTELKTGTIVKLPKEGNLGNCNNWRGITLLSLTSKIFSCIILQRISTAVDGILRQEQTGFRKGKSCIDYIFVLRQILEQSHEWNGSLYVVFVDFEKAFDSLHRDSLWKILRHYGIPKKIVNVIRSLYENFERRVVHNNQVTEPFKVETGVKQGCILSPLFFSMAIDRIIRRTTEGRRQGIQWTLTSLLDDLDFADDIGLLASRNQDINSRRHNSWHCQQAP
ncbi:uncharacterized protein LOC127846107 [Dreissena polymorpha]|uniref:uncharacterized protein LOC127846107 n=1 Tax=Dreissena polymorpha TaxID=45954 RepID=UPI002264F91F|nr:uncharacterized protein LOC127846107 [Dreissena polymorpha]